VGSVIRPAAFCGVVGFKPSYERIPTNGTLHFSPAVDHVGAFATSVADMTLAASVLCEGWTPAAPPSDPILGVPEGPYLDGTETAARDVFETQLTTLAASGMRIVRLPAFAEYDEISRRHNDLTAAEYADVHAERFARYGSLFRARSAALFDRGRTISTTTREAGLTGRTILRDELHTQMDKSGIDAWLCPPAPGPAPLGVSSTGSPALNLPWTHAGMPAVTVPAGLLDGLPLGLQVAGRFGADEQLLGVAKVLENSIAAGALELP
jgi:Asp-tRNA(Asn)/Glu-tRNA(Gln) amidotransferase A subunit family amidase